MDSNLEWFAGKMSNQFFLNGSWSVFFFFKTAGLFDIVFCFFSSLSDEANVILCLYKSGSDEFIGWGPSDDG